MLFVVNGNTENDTYVMSHKGSCKDVKPGAADAFVAFEPPQELERSRAGTQVTSVQRDFADVISNARSVKLIFRYRVRR